MLHTAARAVNIYKDLFVKSPILLTQLYDERPFTQSFALIFLAASMVSPDKGRRTTLTPTGPSSGTALLGPSLLDCNSHDSFQSRGLPDVAEVSKCLLIKWKKVVTEKQHLPQTQHSLNLSNQHVICY